MIYYRHDLFSPFRLRPAPVVDCGIRPAGPAASAGNPRGQPVAELSPRQREILESITRGLSNAQIALQLDISAESVKTHMAKLFTKLGAASRAEAVAIAMRKHLLKI